MKRDFKITGLGILVAFTFPVMASGFCDGARRQLAQNEQGERVPAYGRCLSSNDLTVGLGKLAGTVADAKEGRDLFLAAARQSTACRELVISSIGASLRAHPEMT